MKKSILIFGLIFFTSFLFAQQYTLIPDANFEQALIDLGYDDLIDGRVLTANIESVDNLTIRYLFISDLTGIEDFSALDFLDCAHNQIAYLNLSGNPLLTWLNCGYNPIDSVDISQNSNLIKMICVEGQLTSIDVSNNTNLDFLNIWINNLTSLDVSQNTSLLFLDFSYNEVSSIDLSNNLLLETFWCDENKLTSLNVTANTLLIDLWCIDNQLTELNIKNGNNFNLGAFYAINNPDLTCIEVDSAEEAYLYPNWNKDEWAIYSENCEGVDIEESLTKNIHLQHHPNPFSTSTTFEYTLQHPSAVQIIIFNYFGEKIDIIRQKQSLGKQQVTWNAKGLPSGVYYYRMQAGDQVASGKMVLVK